MKYNGNVNTKIPTQFMQLSKSKNQNELGDRFTLQSLAFALKDETKLKAPSKQMTLKYFSSVSITTHTYFVQTSPEGEPVSKLTDSCEYVSAPTMDG